MSNPDTDRRWPLKPAFPPDLFAGTASYYARYRVPYPQALIDDLRGRLQRTPERMLDLGCGTGQVTLALAPYVGEVLGVDQEPEMIEVAAAETERRGVANVEWQVGRAEDVTAPADSFDLITVSNAFHRMDRLHIARRAHHWITAGGSFALLHCNSLWNGTERWQEVVVNFVDKWIDRKFRSGTTVGPAKSHRDLLRAVGFAVEERVFPTSHVWKLDEIIGYLYSTSVASKKAIGDRVELFESRLRDLLLAVDARGEYRETMQFAYTVAR